MLHCCVAFMWNLSYAKLGANGLKCIMSRWMSCTSSKVVADNDIIIVERERRRPNLKFDQRFSRELVISVVSNETRFWMFVPGRLSCADLLRSKPSCHAITVYHISMAPLNFEPLSLSHKLLNCSVYTVKRSTTSQIHTCSF